MLRPPLHWAELSGKSLLLKKFSIFLLYFIPMRKLFFFPLEISAFVKLTKMQTTQNA